MSVYRQVRIYRKSFNYSLTGELSGYKVIIYRGNQGDGLQGPMLNFRSPMGLPHEKGEWDRPKTIVG